MPALLKKIGGEYPILGICLGHQSIVEYYGGVIDSANQIKHGKASAIEHQHPEIFANLPQPLTVARYHSLMATHVPDGLEVIAQFENIPMAVYHQQDRMLGFQFHPESILTAHGSQLLTQSIQFLINPSA
jgi:anthranilate synthase component 2